MKPEKHYHIRWSKFDWKPFPTSEEATAMAEKIKRQDESYAIEERDDGCEICSVFTSKASQHE